MKMIGFSGPPCSGKDSLARTLMTMMLDLNPRAEVEIISLAAPMRRAGMDLLNVEPGNDQVYARLKADPQDLFVRAAQDHVVAGGRDTLRDFMIAYSESFIKPRYGKDFWARKLKEDAGFLWDGDWYILVPDFGFQDEYNFFAKDFGHENILMVQVQRDGCDFSIDSRSYIAGDNNLALENNQSLQWGVNRILAKIEELGWQF